MYLLIKTDHSKTIFVKQNKMTI